MAAISTSIDNQKDNTGISVITMPVLPVGLSSIRVHTIVDHTIVETIVNNRTAAVSYSVNTVTPTQTAVAMFGVGPTNKGLAGDIESWELRAANNLNSSSDGRK